MKYWKLALVVMFFGSCNQYDYDIISLKHEKVKFRDLPVKISEYIKNPTDYQNDIQTMLLELPKDKESDYSLETIKTWIGPWVSYEKLINNKKKISYKIDQGIPSPYIVFENKLYVPDNFNIFTSSSDMSSLEFTRYDLK